MKVTLLGDSIRRIGYGKRVPELLGDGFEVWQPDDNCRFARHTLRMLFDYKDKIYGSDIIHWNNGLWDVCALFGDGEPFTPIDEYVRTMLCVAKRLLDITPNVIFATTTPVRPDNRYNDNEVIKAYNAAIIPRLKELGIVINDLHATVAEDIPGNIRDDDKIHLTDRGIELCAVQVVGAIRELASSCFASVPAASKSEQNGDMGAPV